MPVLHLAHLLSSACHSTRSDFRQRAISVRTASWAQSMSRSLIGCLRTGLNDRRLSSLGGVAGAFASGLRVRGSFST